MQRHSYQCLMLICNPDWLLLWLPGCDVVSQDGAQFEDALRRLNALESKLAGQVSPVRNIFYHHHHQHFNKNSRWQVTCVAVYLVNMYLIFLCHPLNLSDPHCCCCIPHPTDAWRKLGVMSVDLLKWFQCSVRFWRTSRSWGRNGCRPGWTESPTTLTNCTKSGKTWRSQRLVNFPLRNIWILYFLIVPADVSGGGTVARRVRPG